MAVLRAVLRGGRIPDETPAISSTRSAAALVPGRNPMDGVRDRNPRRRRPTVSAGSRSTPREASCSGRTGRRSDCGRSPRRCSATSPATPAGGVARRTHGGRLARRDRHRRQHHPVRGGDQAGARRRGRAAPAHLAQARLPAGGRGGARRAAAAAGRRLSCSRHDRGRLAGSGTRPRRCTNAGGAPVACLAGRRRRRGCRSPGGCRRVVGPALASAAPGHLARRPIQRCAHRASRRSSDNGGAGAALLNGGAALRQPGWRPGAGPPGRRRHPGPHRRPSAACPAASSSAAAPPPPTRAARWMCAKSGGNSGCGTRWRAACAARASRSSVEAQLHDTANGALLWADRFDAAARRPRHACRAWSARGSSVLSCTRYYANEGNRSLAERPQRSRRAGFHAARLRDLEHGMVRANATPRRGASSSAPSPSTTAMADAHAALRRNLHRRRGLGLDQRPGCRPGRRRAATGARPLHRFPAQPGALLARHRPQPALALRRGPGRVRPGHRRQPRAPGAGLAKRGWVMVFTDRPAEAVAEIKEAMRLSPREPSSGAPGSACWATPA